jgi:hypothetical protein
VLCLPSTFFGLKKETAKGNKVKVNQERDILRFRYRYQAIPGQLARRDHVRENSVRDEMVKALMHKGVDGKVEDWV